MRELVNQAVLSETVQRLFPNINIVTNSKEGSSIRSGLTGKFVELDVWVPDHHICFEFQDIYHYTTTWYAQSPLEAIWKFDTAKKMEAQRKGISLIDVPFWWDGDTHSLILTVLFHRPDLGGILSTLDGSQHDTTILDPFPSSSNVPIPLNSTTDLLKIGYGLLPLIGELMLASFPSEGPISKVRGYSDDKWWMGEKYDGIRVCWNYKENKLFSRSGIALSLPSSFVSAFPKSFLDGEVWFGRGTFIQAQSFVQAWSGSTWSGSKLMAGSWLFFRIVAFDDIPLEPPDLLDPPDPPGSLLLIGYTFEVRYTRLLLLVHCLHPFLTVAFRALCNPPTTLNDNSYNHNYDSGNIDPQHACKDIIANGGEGLIARKYGSTYERGRSFSLLKMKASREDSEGMVVAVHSHSVTIKLPDGNTFKVPASSICVAKALANGDIVSFSYQSFSRKAVPVDPKIVRVRTDISWKDVIHNYAKDKSRTRAQSFYGNLKSEVIAVRRFFENYANSKSLDPLLAASWYNLSLKAITEYPGGKNMLANASGGGLVKTIMNAFPEIGLKTAKFAINYNTLSEVHNRRKWFLQVAKTLAFNPKIPENWYKLKQDQIAHFKGNKSILRYYSQHLGRALIHLFPEVKFDLAKFSYIPVRFWQNKNNQRNFFETLMKRLHLDPLISGDWYQLSHTVVISNKGGLSVIKHYGGNYAKAILELFDDHYLDPTKFVVPDSYFQDLSNRRWFFSNVACKNGIDVLVPEQWYSISKDVISLCQGADAILQYYSGNWVWALTDVFPNLDIDEFKFRNISTSFWQDMANRKWLFEAYARREGFDANIASNWYHRSKELFVHKPLQAVLRIYSGDVVKALLDIFPHIHFEQHMFPKISGSYLTDIKNRQSFFEEFAKKKGFNVHVAENWYSVSSRTIKAQRGSQAVLRPYFGNFAAALVHLYPKTGLKISRFLVSES